MSRRSRRATDPVSSSASMTTRPPTMCRPPEKRSSAVTSALRSDVLLHSTRESSSLTIAVITMCGVPSPSYRALLSTYWAPQFRYPAADPYASSRPHHSGERGGEALGIMPRRSIELGNRSQHQFGTTLTRCCKETMPVNNRVCIRDHRVQRHSVQMGLEHAKMLLGREAVRLPRLRLQVQHDHHLRPARG